jgi:NAD(P)-dependent dehydrogenase (short-subunit alcohol dehydrogenase family)
MLSYLGAGDGQPVAPASAETPQPIPARREPPAPAAAGPQPKMTEASLTEAILGIVARRTGYPPEMLGAGLDLEADLSIDSIKRTEIILELTGHLGAAGSPPPEGAIEALARLKTIGAIVGWLLEHDGVATTDRTEVDAGRAAPVVVGPPRRYRIGLVTEPAVAQEDLARLAGRRIVVIDDEGGVGAAVASALRHHDADALLLGVHHDLEGACARTDGVIHLGALRPSDTPILPGAFAPLRAALVGGARTLLVATGSGGRFARDVGTAADATPGLGVWGLARTIALEYPEVGVRAVDVDVRVEPERIAGWLLGELASAAGARHAWPVVGYGTSGRSLLTAMASPISGSHPSDSGEAILAAVEALGIGPESVVLLTGGGRGITAACAVALAEACGCRIELLGRSSMPDADEPPATAAAIDALALRRVLLDQPGRAHRGIDGPARVEGEVRRILASRELRATLAAVTGMGSPVRYHSADITDTAQLGKVVESIFERWGRLDGVIHGAGVLHDRRIADKTPESFARVFSPKVDGARALAAVLGGRALRFLVMFGSIAGVLGNPGQVDYSAANDALDTLAHTWALHGERTAVRSRAGATVPAGDLAAAAEDAGMAGGAGIAPIVADRIVSIDWGPWAATAGGMVSPELERDFARRGVGMIAPEDGVSALFGELAWGDPSDHQVAYVSGPFDAFAGPASDLPTS